MIGDPEPHNKAMHTDDKYRYTISSSVLEALQRRDRALIQILFLIGLLIIPASSYGRDCNVKLIDQLFQETDLIIVGYVQSAVARDENIRYEVRILETVMGVEKDSLTVETNALSQTAASCAPQIAIARRNIIWLSKKGKLYSVAASWPDRDAMFQDQLENLRELVHLRKSGSEVGSGT